MVGELDVAIADQRTTFEFLGEEILIRFRDYRSALAFARMPIPNSVPAGRLLAFGELRLKAQVGQRTPIDLFPHPNWLVRWLSPTIRGLPEA
ncbi:hypothetical protein [Mariniblastus fucicola]|uniref:Uncharacterized protein n=1 Tax=Mariniblastus fucicola TaxID=980251 RepID=A0A5B9P780_9BACT|nr:hypothetical protein [Mariniblastus fucicola]QEG21045.1 hypothetical protein MFFC18_08970 [Mariniblastus fucicola]